MRTTHRTIALGVALAFHAGLAVAADQLISGRVHLIKWQRLAKFVSPGTFTLPADPTVAGATLRVKDTGSTNEMLFALPASGWRALGSPVQGYKYRGAKGDPCRVVLVKTNLVKAVCRGSAVTIALPLVGTSGITLTSGADRICAEFGGTVVKNDVRQYKAKAAAAPAACASPSGAFLD